MSASPASRHGPAGWQLALLVLAGGMAIMLGLFFFLVNDVWIPIRLPHMPWSEGSTAADFEAHFAALVLAALGLGTALSAVLARRSISAARRRTTAERERADRLEAEIDKISRLLSSSRGKDRLSS